MFQNCVTFYFLVPSFHCVVENLNFRKKSSWRKALIFGRYILSGKSECSSVMTLLTWNVHRRQKTSLDRCCAILKNRIEAFVSLRNPPWGNLRPWRDFARWIRNRTCWMREFSSDSRIFFATSHILNLLWPCTFRIFYPFWSRSNLTRILFWVFLY